jgi:putative membrane protein
VRLGALPVRSFLRHRLTAAALAALTVIPLLYSGLYLWSFWDPFGGMENLPVALVNEDEPATAAGEELHAGDDIAQELLDRGDLDWHLVDADEADAGVEQGRYYVALTIPADFSANLATAADDGADPAPATLRAHYDDANGYIVRQLMGSAFAEIRDAAGATAARDYVDGMFVGFNEIHASTAEAADGAGELAEGTADARDGADRLDQGLGDAATGSGDLHSGLGDLYEGSQTLADGATTASDTVSEKTEALDRLADEWVPRLREDAPDIESGAREAADAASALSDALDDLPDSAAEGADRAEDVDGRLADYLAAHPDLERTDPELYGLITDMRGVTAQAADLAGFVDDNRDRIATIGDRADTVADLAADVADEAPDLADDAASARDQVDALDEGLADLAEGARDLRDGLETAYGGSADLDEGIGALHSGAGDLGEGLAALGDGSRDLSDGLAEGVESIPTFDGADRGDRADVMSDPVRLDAAVANEAPQYGTGFAPFFIALSLWVGAMVTFMVLPAVQPRALASTAPSWRIALAGWLPPLAVGAAQVAVALTALHLLLGLDARRWAALVGVLLLTAAAYTAIVQWTAVRFGPAGRIVALVLLMLQLTSAGGTYPIETSPAFFQALAPYLPMSWVVAAVRHLISGGSMDTVLTACAVLAAYLAGSLLLTWRAVDRRRTWTMAALHPALKL